MPRCFFFFFSLGLPGSLVGGGVLDVEARLEIAGGVVSCTRTRSTIAPKGVVTKSAMRLSRNVSSISLPCDEGSSRCISIGEGTWGGRACGVALTAGMIGVGTAGGKAGGVVVAAGEIGMRLFGSGGVGEGDCGGCGRGAGRGGGVGGVSGRVGGDICGYGPRGGGGSAGGGLSGWKSVSIGGTVGGRSGGK